MNGDGVGALGRALATLALAAVGALGLAGCGIQIPSDPNGSFARIQGDVLRAGASPEAGLVVVEGAEVSGPLADLVTAFAEDNDARVDWTVGSEESLVTGLEEGDLDVAIGGMTADSPWADRAGMTRGYPDLPGAAGRSVVLLVPLGENRLLSELESFIDQEVDG